ncbi:AraC family transcriptional regulator [Idiomarina xiamenensis 10-D-4]|uniref:AraC family transcriptional regulator n=1 Tax=Idiomarina xiamenensis 10-D-4 TaxID=740709 RepID=K2KPN3_9GAMM|nr:AraC family transcriptional regulator [Idiomarina xiamenensis 10-D-4]
MVSAPPTHFSQQHQRLIELLLSPLFGLIATFPEPLSELPTSSRSERLVQRTCQYLLAHIEQRLTLKRISAHMHTNRNRLAQAFRQQLNMGVNAWLRQQRLHKAYRLLSEGTLSVQAIAERVGYPSQGNFSTAFKRQFKQTPQQVRRQPGTTSGVLPTG